jgi:hypothetical protein
MLALIDRIDQIPVRYAGLNIGQQVSKRVNGLPLVREVLSDDDAVGR